MRSRGHASVECVRSGAAPEREVSAWNGCAASSANVRPPKAALIPHAKPEPGAYRACQPAALPGRATGTWGHAPAPRALTGTWGLPHSADAEAAAAAPASSGLASPPVAAAASLAHSEWTVPPPMPSVRRYSWEPKKSRWA